MQFPSPFRVTSLEVLNPHRMQEKHVRVPVNLCIFYQKFPPLPRFFSGAKPRFLNFLNEYSGQPELKIITALSSFYTKGFSTPLWEICCCYAYKNFIAIKSQKGHRPFKAKKKRKCK